MKLLRNALLALGISVSFSSCVPLLIGSGAFLYGAGHDKYRQVEPEETASHALSGDLVPDPAP